MRFVRWQSVALMVFLMAPLAFSAAGNLPAGSDEAKVAALYRSFMDEATVERLGATPLRGHLDRIRAATTREALAEGMGRTMGSAGGSFFGVNTPGKKFVFVVDASSSMNHPFPGPGKTALGRVKLELLSCVSQMSEDQQFYIVYFNDRAIPMPARTMVSASLEAKQHYLTWMAKQKGEGQTEPEDALLLALRLKPDVIYFLTDGAFKYRVVKRVADMNRQRVAIHTVCFGNADGEKFMQMVASQNGGTYHFVGFDSPEAAGAEGTTAAAAAASPADTERVAANPDETTAP